MRWSDHPDPETIPVAPQSPPPQPPAPTRDQLILWANETMDLFRAGIPFELAYNMTPDVRSAFVAVVRLRQDK